MKNLKKNQQKINYSINFVKYVRFLRFRIENMDKQP